MNTQTLILTFFFCLLAIISCSQVKSKKDKKVVGSSDNLEGKSHYANPIDQKIYSTEGEFKNYNPEKKIKKTATDLDHVVLLNGDDEMNESVDIEDLASVIEDIKTMFQKHFSESMGSGRIMIQVNIFKEKKTEFQYATQENIDLEIMTAFEKEMRKLKTINSKKHEIIFQLIFRVNQAPKD